MKAAKCRSYETDSLGEEIAQRIGAGHGLFLRDEVTAIQA